MLQHSPRQFSSGYTFRAVLQRMSFSRSEECPRSLYPYENNYVSNMYGNDSRCTLVWSLLRTVDVILSPVFKFQCWLSNLERALTACVRVCTCSWGWVMMWDGYEKRSIETASVCVYAWKRELHIGRKRGVNVTCRLYKCRCTSTLSTWKISYVSLLLPCLSALVCNVTCRYGELHGCIPFKRKLIKRTVKRASSAASKVLADESCDEPGDDEQGHLATNMQVWIDNQKAFGRISEIKAG